MKKVLIVVDMQNDFINGSLGTKEAAAIVTKVFRKISSFDGDVYFTRDTHPKDYLQTSEGKHLPVQHCIKGTDGWRFESGIEKLYLESGHEAIEKNTFGAKDLPAVLAENYPAGMESIELCGLCTDICVVSNALLIKAALPEVPISVDARLCAGVTPDAHQAALATMRSCQVQVAGA